MKLNKSSVAAICVLAVMLICWFAIEKMSVEDKYNNEGARSEIISLERGETQEIAFKNSEEDFTLVNKGGSYFIKESNVEADVQAVSQVLDNILKIDGKLLEKKCSDIAQYGLDTPKAVVSFTAKGEKTTLTLGNLTPAETEYYLMNDDGDVYSIYTNAGTALLSRRWQFMDLTLFTSAYDDISTVSVKGENSFSAEKETAGTWKIESEKDGEYEISDEMFREKIGLYFENMYAKRLVANTAENRALSGLDSPEGTVTITNKRGDKTEFKVFRDKENREAAVIKNDGEDIFITIDSYFDMLDVKKDNLK